MHKLDSIVATCLLFNHTKDLDPILFKKKKDIDVMFILETLVMYGVYILWKVGEVRLMLANLMVAVSQM